MKYTCHTLPQDTEEQLFGLKVGFLKKINILETEDHFSTVVDFLPWYSRSNYGRCVLEE